MLELMKLYVDLAGIKAKMMKLYVELAGINAKMMWVDFQLWLYE